MTTPTMNTAHSRDIARRRPRASAVLCEVSQKCHRWEWLGILCAKKSTDEGADTEEGDDEAFADDVETTISP